MIHKSHHVIQRVDPARLGRRWTRPGETPISQHRFQCKRHPPSGTRRQSASAAAVTGWLLHLSLAGVHSAHAASLTLAWDKVKDNRVQVYQLHHGTASGRYEQVVETADDSVTVGNLQAGTTYFLAVRACDPARVKCSAFSNEISGTTQHAAPKASFTARVTQGQAPFTVLFTDRSTGLINSREWQLGDGSTVTGAALVTHTYTAPGTYDVRLTVTGPGGSGTQVSDAYITVLAPSVPIQPVARQAETDPEINSSTEVEVDDAGGAAGGDPIVEAGEIVIDQEWRWVDFERTFSDPVVIVKPLSLNDSQPATARADDVYSDGFWLRVQEWDYLDGKHAPEKAGYLVMERGQHKLPNGTWAEAGLVETGGSNEVLDVALDAPFASVPVVLSALNTANGQPALAMRIHDVDKFGFSVRVQEQEANAPGYVDESFGFIAWEPSSGVVDGRRYEVAHTRDPVSQRLYKITYQTEFVAAPVFLADMQTMKDGDTANLRWRTKNDRWVRFQVTEEKSWDRETRHPGEDVGYLIIE